MILFVCEGNVCRSPLAADLLTRSLDRRGLAISIESAGTRALVGEGMDPATAQVAEHLGLDPSRHRSRQLTKEMLSANRLVLTATRRIRRAVVQLYPPAVKDTFTIRQFGRIMCSAAEEPTGGHPAADDLVDAIRSFAAKHRGLQAPVDPDLDDVVDPYGRESSVHELAARQMLPALGELALALGGEPMAWQDAH